MYKKNPMVVNLLDLISQTEWIKYFFGLLREFTSITEMLIGGSNKHDFDSVSVEEIEKRLNVDVV